MRIKGIKVGRNDICPMCKSGKKFKECCWNKFSVFPEDYPTPEYVKYIKKMNNNIKRLYKSAVERNENDKS